MAITLVVEDGSGNPDANSYTDISFLDQYHSDRGNAYWDGLDDEVKKACAIRATDYIDKRFKRRFRGFRSSQDQSLAWPRFNAFDDDGYQLVDVPEQIKKAHAEYCLRAAIYNTLAPDPIRPVPSQDMSDTADPNGDQSEVIVGNVRSKTEKVGPLTESVTYDSVAQLTEANLRGSRAEQSVTVNDIYIPQYPEADLLIEETLESSISVKLERA